MKIIKPLTDATVKQGQPAEFTCELSKPNYSVTWMQSDFIIPVDNKKYQQTVEGVTHRLVIPQTSPDMNVEFTIIAGEERSTAKLVVVGMFILLIDIT